MSLARGRQTLLTRGVFDLTRRAAAAGELADPELRWLAPVRPGDTLHTEAQVKDKRPSRSKPDRGTLRMAYTIKNQENQPVMTFVCTHILSRRPPE